MKKADDDLRKECKRSDFTTLERGKFRKDVAEGMAVAEHKALLTGLSGKPARRRTVAG